MINRAFFAIIKNTVNLVGCDHLRSCCNFRIVGLQFFIDLVDILHWITTFYGSGIYNVDDNSCTLNMTEEFMSKSHTFRCTLDQSRDICDNKTAVIRIYNAKIRA